MKFFILSAIIAIAFAAPQDRASEPSEGAPAYGPPAAPAYEAPAAPAVYDTPPSPVAYGTPAPVLYEAPKVIVPTYETTEAYAKPYEKVETPAPYQPKDEYYTAPPEVEIHEEHRPHVIEVIEEKLVDFSVGHNLHEHIAVITAGKDFGKALTAKIVAPVIIFNSKVATAAGALPPLLAAKGAIIGSAIATPIKIGAIASSKVATGVTHKLVTVPITLGAAAASVLINSHERGEEIVRFNIEHGVEILKDGFIRVGHIILKPIAIVVGAQTALTGAGFGIAGTGIKGVGLGIQAVGAKMVATGLTAKGLGHRLIQKQFPPYI